VRALQVRVGLALLERIKDAFIMKSQGGTDVTGEKWAPLSKHTIAYSRPHPGMKRQKLPGGGTIGREPARRKGMLSVTGVPRRNPGLSGYHPSWMLDNARRERWWALYRTFKGKYGGDKSRAAATAWTILKAEGGVMTIMEKFGDTKVEILRSTGLLFNSLSPGVDADAAPMFPPHVAKQIFRTGAGAAIVGTNRLHAAEHHQGVLGKIPQRRLWPSPDRWTGVWWESLTQQATKGVIEIATYLIGRLR
jgi:hypothetical protein